MESPGEYSPEEIIVPIDMSELSNLALKYAHVGAQLFNARITVLHSMYFEAPRYLSAQLTDQLLEELDQAKSDARKHLAEHVSKVLGKGIDDIIIDYKTVDSDPAGAILDTIESTKAGLVVMGTHGYSGFKHWMLGSVAEKVLHTSTVPVFTVRQKINDFIDTEKPDARPEIGRILCPSNLTPSSARALQTAASLARRLKARLSVLYTTDANATSPEDQLQAWIRENLSPQTAVETLVRQGEAAEEIIAAADQLDSDLIVLGICHRPFGKGTVVGRTTEDVARHAPVPVLTVPYFK